MIHYYTSREISKKLNINLARWKRWSRAFLPPDPLGGVQSGYARQYIFKDLFKVFLCGHIVSHLKMSVPDSLKVMLDLSPWLKKNGYFHMIQINDSSAKNTNQSHCHRIYFCPLKVTSGKRGSEFGYLIRKTITFQYEGSSACRPIRETGEETMINSEAADGFAFLQDSAVRMINLTPLYRELIERL
jgi:hypothetical protein